MQIIEFRDSRAAAPDLTHVKRALLYHEQAGALALMLSTHETSATARKIICDLVRLLDHTRYANGSGYVTIEWGKRHGRSFGGRLETAAKMLVRYQTCTVVDAQLDCPLREGGKIIGVRAFVRLALHPSHLVALRDALDAPAAGLTAGARELVNGAAPGQDYRFDLTESFGRELSKGLGL